MLVNELTRRFGQLDHIETMVEALYNAQLIAPLETEADAILAADQECADLAGMHALLVPDGSDGLGIYLGDPPVKAGASGSERDRSEQNPCAGGGGR